MKENYLGIFSLAQAEQLRSFPPKPKPRRPKRRLNKAELEECKNELRALLVKYNVDLTVHYDQEIHIRYYTADSSAQISYETFWPYHDLTEEIPDE